MAFFVINICFAFDCKEKAAKCDFVSNKMMEAAQNRLLTLRSLFGCLCFFVLFWMIPHPSYFLIVDRYALAALVGPKKLK